MTGSTVVHRLAALADAEPERLGFDVAGARRTWGELFAGARRAAAGLVAHGVTPGDRVALVLGTTPEVIELLFGAQLVGAVPMIVNPSLPPQAIERRASLVDARVVVDAENVKSLVDRTPLVPDRLPAPDDLAYLQLTSGTTGEPHAAMIRHRSLTASLAASRVRLDITSTDVLASWVPLHHDLGLVRFVFLPVFLGLPCHLLTPSLVNLRAWLETMTRVGATITGAPDFAYRIAARTVDPAGIDLSALRFATNGGEPVRASTIAAFEARFGLTNVVRPAYGLAEATLGVCSCRAGEPLRVDVSGAVSCGPAYDGIGVRVAGDGAIEVRGEPVFAGYFGDDEATRAAFTADGWLRTGDTGRLDPDGHLFVLGRTRAMIKRAGALVAPRELEEAADLVPGVRLSAAVGVPRERDGTEDVVVVVEARAELAPEERQALVRRVMDAVTSATGVSPGRILVAGPRTIPLTANGKIRHAVLKASVAAGELDLARADQPRG